MIEREVLADGIVIVRLAHGKANVLDLELLESLEQAIDHLRDPGIRAAVLTGRDAIFCAGVDLFRVSDGGAEYLSRFLPALRRALHALFTLEKPVVAAANGHAIAGGALLLLACDYRMMAEGGGRVGVPELRVGVPFPAIALEILRGVLPPAQFARMIYRGETFEGEQLERFGIVDERVPSAELRERAIARARELAGIPAATFAITKRQLRAPVCEAYRALGESFDREVDHLWGSEPVREAMRGYLQRTLKKS
ncbi:MAG: enoyl-CoA hydratase/isomerase family protein [Planctomycetota bacterium]